MRFTAQIDHHTSDKASRCLRPRFSSFLGSVRQFAALVYVVVGGSQNIIACGVWSLVRMSILVCERWYYDKQDINGSCQRIFLTLL